MDELIELNEILEQITKEVEKIKNINNSIELLEQTSKKSLEIFEKAINKEIDTLNNIVAEYNNILTSNI